MVKNCPIEFINSNLLSVLLVQQRNLIGRIEAWMDVPGYPGHASNLERKGYKYYMN